MIGYHYSPSENRESIAKHGLLVPTKHPKLTKPTVCSQGHRNPHISLGLSPVGAWELSGGFLAERYNRGERFFAVAEWDLYQVNLIQPLVRRLGDELQVRHDIQRRYVKMVGHRWWWE